MLFPCSLFFSLIFNCFCFSNALPREEYVNFACSVILLWSDGNISSPVRFSYLSILPDNDTDIFAASVLTYFSFSSYILSSFVMLIFYIVSKRLFLKHEELFDARVVSITKKYYGSEVDFL